MGGLEQSFTVGQPALAISPSHRQECDQLFLQTLVYDGQIELEQLMINTGVGSIFAAGVVAATIASVLAIAPPAYARSGPGGGSSGLGHSATRAASANVSGGHHFSSAGSPREFSSSGQREGWHTPPGWIGHGEKRGWDGGKMPPGLSHRDHDPQWRDHKFDRDDERGHHERTQLYTGDLERIGR